MTPAKEPLERVLIMLCGMVVFFTVALFIAEKFFVSDSQLFQVLAGLLTGFGGALLMRVKPRSIGGEGPDPPPGTTSQVTSTTKTTVQELPKEPVTEEPK
jgi:hypothetical protein